MWHLKIKDRKGTLHHIDERFETPALALSHAYTVCPMGKLHSVIITHVDEAQFTKDRVHWLSDRKELLSH